MRRHQFTLTLSISQKPNPVQEVQHVKPGLSNAGECASTDFFSSNEDVDHRFTDAMLDKLHTPCLTPNKQHLSLKDCEELKRIILKTNTDATIANNSSLIKCTISADNS